MHLDPEIRWLIGIVATIVIAMISTFRSLSSKISAGNKAIYAKIEEADKDIGHKIEDVKQRYVRRDDLDSHISRLDQTVNDLRREQKELRDEQRDQHQQVMNALASAAGQR
ncbi:MAG: hypothetical protein JKY94_10880 [Rhodobacteraceae bacterium]|nr:hypothetical protein [Paracoccaceae bacterium]